MPALFAKKLDQVAQFFLPIRFIWHCLLNFVAYDGLQSAANPMSRHFYSAIRHSKPGGDLGIGGGILIGEHYRFQFRAESGIAMARAFSLETVQRIREDRLCPGPVV